MGVSRVLEAFQGCSGQDSLAIQRDNGSFRDILSGFMGDSGDKEMSHEPLNSVTRGCRSVSTHSR